MCLEVLEIFTFLSEVLCKYSMRLVILGRLVELPKAKTA